MFDWLEMDSREGPRFCCNIYNCFKLIVTAENDYTWAGTLQVGEQVIRHKTGLKDPDHAKEEMARAYVSFIEKCVNDIGIGFVRKKKILIIDDEEALVRLISKFLTKQGYETLTAANGEQGLQILRNHEIDLIITDLTMPIMDGEAFLRILKKRYVSEIPVIVTTGDGTIEKAVDLMKLGVRDFLLKPVDLEQLKQVTQSTLIEF